MQSALFSTFRGRLGWSASTRPVPTYILRTYLTEAGVEVVWACEAPPGQSPWAG